METFGEYNTLCTLLSNGIVMRIIIIHPIFKRTLTPSTTLGFQTMVYKKYFEWLNNTLSPMLFNAILWRCKTYQ
jgi:hypothetical protein